PLESKESKETKILVFDVSETLQTELPKSDGIAEKTIVDFGDDFRIERYTTLIGGKKTADLLNQAKKNGIKIYIATNNGNSELINAEAEFQQFLLRYGFV